MSTFIKKVLVEKYSISSMARWIVKNKKISIKNDCFEKAAKWRDLENHINKKFYLLDENKNQNKLHLDVVERYFILFEEI